MGKTVKIECDGCGRDLTTTGNCVDYRLHLSNESIPGWGGVVTSMYLTPILDNDLYVCSRGCLVDVLWEVCEQVMGERDERIKRREVRGLEPNEPCACTNPSCGARHSPRQE